MINGTEDDVDDDDGTSDGLRIDVHGDATAPSMSMSGRAISGEGSDPGFIFRNQNSGIRTLLRAHSDRTGTRTGLLACLLASGIRRNRGGNRRRDPEFQRFRES